MAKRGRPKKGKPEQQEMTGDGLERVKNEAVERAALEYEEARDERTVLSKAEIAAKTKLIETMHASELTVYKFQWSDGDDRVIEVLPKENIKVSREKAPEPSTEE